MYTGNLVSKTSTGTDECAGYESGFMMVGVFFKSVGLLDAAEKCNPVLAHVLCRDMSVC